MQGAPASAIGGVNVKGTGYIDQTLFLGWLHHFQAVTNCSINAKHLLLLDGHESHKTLEAVEYGRTNGIVMISLPPHSSHRLQPLDCTFFKTLNTNYERQVHSFMMSHHGERVTQFHVAGLFGAAYNRSATVESAANGFRCTGIWPFDRHKFDAELQLQQAAVAAAPPQPAAVPPPPAATHAPPAATHLLQQLPTPHQLPPHLLQQLPTPHQLPPHLLQQLPMPHVLPPHPHELLLCKPHELLPHPHQPLLSEPHQLLPHPNQLVLSEANVLLHHPHPHQLLLSEPHDLLPHPHQLILSEPHELLPHPHQLIMSEANVLLPHPHQLLLSEPHDLLPHPHQLLLSEPHDLLPHPHQLLLSEPHELLPHPHQLIMYEANVLLPQPHQPLLSEPHELLPHAHQLLLSEANMLLPTPTSSSCPSRTSCCPTSTNSRPSPTSSSSTSHSSCPTRRLPNQDNEWIILCQGCREENNARKEHSRLSAQANILYKFGNHTVEVTARELLPYFTGTNVGACIFI